MARINTRSPYYVEIEDDEMDYSILTQLLKLYVDTVRNAR